MTKEEALDLKKNEVLLRLTEEEVVLIVASLDRIRGEVERERDDYIRKNPLSHHQDVIFGGFSVQIEQIATLTGDIDNHKRDY